MRLLLALIALTVVAGCGNPTSGDPADCRKADLASYATAIQNQIISFRQQADLVASTPRASIGAPLQRLLDIQTATRAIAAPGCLADYHSRIIAAMNAFQQAYQGFAAQALTNTDAAALLGSAKNALDAQESELTQIRAGAVPPAPTDTPTAVPTSTPTAVPTPTATPKRSLVNAMAVLLLSPGDSDSNGKAHVCPSDRFNVIDRKTIETIAWVQVRVVSLGNGSCSPKTPHATLDTEGWLREKDIETP
jgi:hypothetical protein